MKAQPKTIKLAIEASEKAKDYLTVAKLKRVQKGCWNPKARKCDCPACGGGND